MRPHGVASKSVGESWTTLFVFPFNNEEIAPQIACKEIGDRLRTLSARTFLFLRNIKEIEYTLPNKSEGFYYRDEVTRGPARQVSVIGENDVKDEEQKWLIFERPVHVPENSGTVRVEISFRLETEEVAGKEQDRIVKVKNSPLVVYFPTERDTRLGFLIQGPYRTTPSRDNVPKDDDWNGMLIKETAALIKDVLSEIKALGLLSTSFLETLPIRIEDFPDDSMFYPIFESVQNALITKALLPADGDTFVSAGEAKLARGGDLRKLLTQAQLSQLFQSTATMKWLDGDITQDRKPELRSYLTNVLEVEEVTPEILARRISQSFLSVQSDEWFVEFYGYLTGQEALWRAPRNERELGGILRSKPILRLSNGSQAVPFRSGGSTPNAFLPPPEDTSYPIISRSIINDQRARTFLKRLGLSEPDVFDDIVNTVLSKYAKSNGVAVSDTEHWADMQKIVCAIASDSDGEKRKLIHAARGIPFLKGCNSSGNTEFKKPDEIYLNTPELRRYFSGVQKVWFLHDEYNSFDIDPDIWCDFGVSSLPRKIQTSDGLRPDDRRRFTQYERFENYDLDCLEQFLEAIQECTDFEEQTRTAYVLWRFIQEHLNLDADLFKAKYDWFHYKAKTKYLDSMIFVRLTESKWLPTNDGSLKKPSEVTTDQLLQEFLDATALIENLGITRGLVQSEYERKHEYAKELGVSLEDIEFLKNNREGFNQWKVLVSRAKERPIFPSRPVPNPERRQERLIDELTDAPNKEYQKRERSVRISSGAIDPSTWLRNQYTNEDDQMVCQICKEEMPFRKRNGAHYFEQKEVLSPKYLPKECEPQCLALCPLCAAKYQEFIKTDDELMAALRQEIISAKGYEIPISLGDEQTSICFVESHLNDLKIFLDEAE